MRHYFYRARTVHSKVKVVLLYRVRNFVLILRLLPTAVPLSKSINTKFHLFIPIL
jgi:hypothetical protein